MISYIVGLVAVLLIFSNPISELLFPGQADRPHVSPRPQLNESLLAIDAPNATVPACPPDTYTARILHRAPLVVYLEGFLSAEEQRYLLDIRYDGPALPGLLFHHRDVALESASIEDFDVHHEADT